MNKLLSCASLALMMSACASIQNSDERPPNSKLEVVEVGTKQNAELVFCETDNCPQRTPKFIPKPAPPTPAPPSTPTSIKAVETPKQVHFKVHFRWGWGRLDTSGFKEVDEIISSGHLKNAKSIVVAGRTDPTGSLKFNEKLAIRRAQAVKAALVKTGVPVETITAVAQAPCCDGDLRASKRIMQELRRTDIDITITTK
ncbi:OmpA family protein [Sulfuricystis multivorans]|uniref:OmpA family protein n=1 Tax=Sulfuricystis multivorans TaxID=2211108 RepID=UPI001559C75C|nr:OmpA family protein [Sulfuricystis multivorans]